MRTALKARLRKSTLVLASTAPTVAGVIAGSGSAQAAGPGDAPNIRGVDPGNTDSMIDKDRAEARPQDLRPLRHGLGGCCTRGAPPPEGGCCWFIRGRA
ncbi:hypothetical protein Sipo8835_38020, partial [Streptomyces ipomoeae]|uniref:Tat pathway signal sequence domain protein n=2 Tax=Streptomyces ipomoeae TaxID=103232 RepID=L1KXI3_9ACTN